MDPINPATRGTHPIGRMLWHVARDESGISSPGG